VQRRGGTPLDVARNAAAYFYFFYLAFARRPFFVSVIQERKNPTRKVDRGKIQKNNIKTR
jgi:hypothetical protein